MTVEALEQTGGFIDTMAFETLFRTWSVAGRSVRPDHRMVGHTGFVVVARGWPTLPITTTPTAEPLTG